MNQNILPTDNSVQEKKANRALMVTMGVVVLAVAIIAIAGLLMMNHPDEVVEGQIEGTTVRVSGKLPGRVVEFFVEEGDTVAAGDTLVRIHSSVMEAQMTEARAMQQVAEAQNRKVDNGTRSQIIQAAADMVSQATAAVEITRKTYERMENLFREGVVSAQKRDEAKAAYDAAVATQPKATCRWHAPAPRSRTRNRPRLWYRQPVEVWPRYRPSLTTVTWWLPATAPST